MLLNPRYVPLTGERLTTDDESLFERLDAFRVRYADLQDAIGNKLFRSILLVLDEKSIIWQIRFLKWKNTLFYCQWMNSA